MQQHCATTENVQQRLSSLSLQANLSESVSARGGWPITEPILCAICDTFNLGFDQQTHLLLGLRAWLQAYLQCC